LHKQLQGLQQSRACCSALWLAMAADVLRCGCSSVHIAGCRWLIGRSAQLLTAAGTASFASCSQPRKLPLLQHPCRQMPRLLQLSCVSLSACLRATTTSGCTPRAAGCWWHGLRASSPSHSLRSTLGRSTQVRHVPAQHTVGNAARSLSRIVARSRQAGPPWDLQ
jgi:hypothetical protein